MLKDVSTPDIMELINYIRKNHLAQFEWMYKILLKELCIRQPYAGRLYIYRDIFGDDDSSMASK